MRRKPTTRTIVIATLALISHTSDLAAARVQPTDEQVQIVAEDMCCKGCARKVSGQLYTVRGVKAVEADMSTHTVTVALPRPSAITLGQLWQAVEEGDGGPATLVTRNARFYLTRTTTDGATQQTQGADLLHYIEVDNLHRKGCAQKIAAKLYALKGITKVSLNMPQETLIVQTDQNTRLSPWLLVDVVTQAEERPLSVSGGYGTLSIEWATKQPSKNHQQAQQSTYGGL